jgi:hypothetical protein
MNIEKIDATEKDLKLRLKLWLCIPLMLILAATSVYLGATKSPLSTQVALCLIAIGWIVKVIDLKSMKPLRKFNLSIALTIVLVCFLNAFPVYSSYFILLYGILCFVIAVIAAICLIKR